MSWSTGDFTGDGKVDINDLNIVLAVSAAVAQASAGLSAPCRSLRPSPCRRRGDWAVGLRVEESPVGHDSIPHTQSRRGPASPVRLIFGAP